MRMYGDYALIRDPANTTLRGSELFAASGIGGPRSDRATSVVIQDALDIAVIPPGARINNVFLFPPRGGGERDPPPPGLIQPVTQRLRPTLVLRNALRFDCDRQLSPGLAPSRSTGSFTDAR